MMRIYFHDYSDNDHDRRVYNVLKKALEAYLVTPDVHEVEIGITASGASLSDNMRQWSLVWDNGKSLLHRQNIYDAISRPGAVLELHLLARNEGGIMTLRKAAFAPLPGRYEATLARACDCAVALIAQALRDCENSVLTGTPFLNPCEAAWQRQMEPLEKFLWRMRAMRRWGLDFLERVLLHENWMIGLIDAPIGESLRWRTCPPVRWIGSRAENRYLADPFAWPGKSNVVLCEEYDFSTRMGRIKQLFLDEGSIRDEVPVDFGLTGHLSYPFLFEHEGAIFCLPESCAMRRLTIYRWDDAGGWRDFATPLTDIAAADSILFTHGGYYWIAYTDTEIDRFDNLNLCYATSLAGPWRLHANNPVRRDPRNARCGGTPFRQGGKLYRPAQDCAVRYGAALRIMEIVTCTPLQYIEQEVTLIGPEQGDNPDGFHTLSSYGGKCLVDGKRMIFAPRHILAKIIRRLAVVPRLPALLLSTIGGWRMFGA